MGGGDDIGWGEVVVETLNVPLQSFIADGSGGFGGVDQFFDHVQGLLLD
jgi:hypothetical protein